MLEIINKVGRLTPTQSLSLTMGFVCSAYVLVMALEYNPGLITTFLAESVKQNT